MAPRPPPKRSGLDKKRPGLDDMTLLTKPTPQGIRDNLKERLEAECIYTYIGNVLVAANPFTWLQIYSSEDAKRYMRQPRLDVPPHVFAVAEAAFRAMTEEVDSQCVIISGESGAGKTEASKHIQGHNLRLFVFSRIASMASPGEKALGGLFFDLRLFRDCTCATQATSRCAPPVTRQRWSASRRSF